MNNFKKNLFKFNPDFSLRLINKDYLKVFDLIFRRQIPLSQAKAEKEAEEAKKKKENESDTEVLENYIDSDDDDIWEKRNNDLLINDISLQDDKSMDISANPIFFEEKIKEDTEKEKDSEQSQFSPEECEMSVSKDYNHELSNIKDENNEWQISYPFINDIKVNLIYTNFQTDDFYYFVEKINQKGTLMSCGFDGMEYEKKSDGYIYTKFRGKFYVTDRHGNDRIFIKFKNEKYIIKTVLDRYNNCSYLYHHCILENEVFEPIKISAIFFADRLAYRACVRENVLFIDVKGIRVKVKKINIEDLSKIDKNLSKIDKNFNSSFKKKHSFLILCTYIKIFSKKIDFDDANPEKYFDMDYKALEKRQFAFDLFLPKNNDVNNFEFLKDDGLILNNHRALTNKFRKRISWISRKLRPSPDVEITDFDQEVESIIGSLYR